MSDFKIKDIADALYSSFLARDFFGKVLPGGILLAAMLKNIVINPIALSKLYKMPFFVWLLVYGVCWIIGFAVQAVGEFFFIVRAFPYDEKEIDFQKRKNDFNNAAPSEMDKIQMERFVVIKEATGNIAFSIFIAALITFVPTWTKISNTVLCTSLAILAIIALFYYQIVHQKRQRDWMKIVIERSKINTNPSEKGEAPNN